MTWHIEMEDPTAQAVVNAIQIGEVPRLKRLLTEHPGLATARIDRSDRSGTQSRSLLHIATDWPGHCPNGPAVIAALVQAGADVNARFVGSHTEMPLHWAASRNDVAVLDALLDAGADIEAAGGVIGTGTPLADARAFGQWDTARRLIERGAWTTLTDAATLGLKDRVQAYVETAPAPTLDAITGAFWGACHGGQRPAAEYLLARSTDINWIGHGGVTPLDVARRDDAERLVVVQLLRTSSAGYRLTAQRRRTTYAKAPGVHREPTRIPTASDDQLGAIQAVVRRRPRLPRGLGTPVRARLPRVHAAETRRTVVVPHGAHGRRSVAPHTSSSMMLTRSTARSSPGESGRTSRRKTCRGRRERWT